MGLNNTKDKKRSHGNQLLYKLYKKYPYGYINRGKMESHCTRTAMTPLDPTD